MNNYNIYRLYFFYFIRWFIGAVFALTIAAIVGLFVYAFIHFSLWWPTLVSQSKEYTLILSTLSLLPFLIFFIKLKWGRPLNVILKTFSSIIMALDHTIDDLFVKYKKNKD
tara:strand:+ start:11280 stop:11612 length:333 start_codon:yes stop_codon:yes gene_type:complete